MKLSNQAIGALMLALQKCLMEESDITEILKDFNFVISGAAQDELIVTNPPVVKFDEPQSKFEY